MHYAYRQINQQPLIKKKALGVDQTSRGEYTLRKAWGYHQRVTFGVDLPRLMVCYQLREQQASYIANSGHKKVALSDDNTYFWNVFNVN